VPVDGNHYDAGDAVTVLGNTGNLINSGKYFTGWNTSADGTGTGHMPSDNFNMGHDNVTLFAQWSNSGESWTQVTAAAAFSARNFHSSVVFKDKMWVIGGRDSSSTLNDVWSSDDGVTWTKVATTNAFPARAGHTSVVFDDKMWIIGGFEGNNSWLNDVWSSDDGATWTKVTATAAFSARSGHT